MGCGGSYKTRHVYFELSGFLFHTVSKKNNLVETFLHINKG
jgi:hypothetical protein